MTYWCKYCPTDECLGVLVITKSDFLILLPDLIVATVSWFWVQWLHLHLLLVQFSFCNIASVLSAYFCLFNCPVCGMFLYCSCLHCLFLPYLSCYIAQFYGAAWNCQYVHLVCLPPVSGWLLPFHSRDHLLHICWWIYLSLHSGDYLGYFGHPDSVTSTILVIYPMSCYHQWYTIFCLHCYSWPCR